MIDTRYSPQLRFHLKMIAESDWLGFKKVTMREENPNIYRYKHGFLLKAADFEFKTIMC